MLQLLPQLLHRSSNYCPNEITKRMFRLCSDVRADFQRKWNGPRGADATPPPAAAPLPPSFGNIGVSLFVFQLLFVIHLYSSYFTNVRIITAYVHLYFDHFTDVPTITTSISNSVTTQRKVLHKCSNHYYTHVPFMLLYKWNCYTNVPIISTQIFQLCHFHTNIPIMSLQKGNYYKISRIM